MVIPKKPARKKQGVSNGPQARKDGSAKNLDRSNVSYRSYIERETRLSKASKQE